jgi:RNA polymerase sigma-70 factor (ECF subfamily)
LGTANPFPSDPTSNIGVFELFQTLGILSGRGEQKVLLNEENKDEEKDLSDRLTTEQLRELVLRWKAGDTTAFESVFRDSSGWVHSLVRGIVGDERLAAECVQETFLLAWKKIGHLQDPNCFLAWLKRIAVNKSLRVAEQAKRLPVSRFDSESSVHVPGPESSRPEVEVTTRMSLLEALGRLPVKERSALVLRELHGSTYSELADLFAVPVGTIRSRLHSAKTKVQAYLTQSEKI